MPDRFIGRSISVEFDRPPALSKKPPCPDRFTWQDETFQITAVRRQWQDFGRRGRMARNMRPANLRRAAQRGSWGVGRFYFQVETEEGRVFELYYDRAPKSAAQRSGAWFLTKEIDA